MQKHLFTLLSICLTSVTTLAKDPYVNQLGLAFEQRSSGTNTFLFFNQIICQKLYWEVRGYFVRNYIVTAPPRTPPPLPTGEIISAITNTVVTPPVPLPTPDDEINLNGGGIVGKIGWLFHPTNKVIFTPYLRLQWFKDNNNPYKDVFGNKIESKVQTYYLGAKLEMAVNELFVIYADYFAGYQKVNYDVAGYYTIVPSDLENEQLTATFEIGAPYKLNKCWFFTPYIQLAVTSNEPSFNTHWGPIQNNGLTGFSPVFAAKITYRWPT